MRTLRRLFTYLRHQKKLVALLLVALVAGSFTRTLPPTLSKVAIDEGVIGANLGVLVSTVGGFLGAMLLSNLFLGARLYAGRWSAQRAIHDIRNDLYAHIGSKSMSFFDEHQTGDLMSRVTNDVNLIQMFFNMFGNLILSSIGLLIFNLAFMFALDWVVALALLAVLPLMAFLQIWFRSVMPLFRISNQQVGVLNVAIREAVAGVKVIQAFGREGHQERIFDRDNSKLRRLRLEIAQRLALYFQGIELVAGFATALILGLGSWRVINGDMSLGALVAFQGYLLILLQPTRFFGFAVQMCQQAIASGERVFQIIDTPMEVSESQNAVDLVSTHADLRFDHVTFRYAESSPILRDISFNVPAGKTLAIVGRSGSGKSTIANLIPRFYDPTAGHIYLGGQDLRGLKLKSLRSQIGMVMQDTFLFNMSVLENIRFGRTDATEAEVESAARAAAAHNFIMEMPKGYDTLIGDRGVKLSGGQRQRISIARALLVEPRVLILDEATSSVDTETDQEIQQALQGLMRSRTTIVIAHRLSTIERADQIIMIADGAVEARGTNSELLASSEAYRLLYALQYRSQVGGLPDASSPQHKVP